MDDYQIGRKTVFVFWRKRTKRPRSKALKHVTLPGSTWFEGRQEATIALKCGVEDLQWERKD